MYPVLLTIGNISISSFGFMIVVAFLSANYILKKDFIRYGYDPDFADDIIFRAALGGILGAKLYYLIENAGNGAYENIYGIVNILNGIITFDSHLISIGIQSFGAGLVFLGGLIGGLLMVTLFIRKKELVWLKIADIIAPLIALGHGIGRIGCLLVGDDYGIPTNLPWAISFPNGAPPSTAYYIEKAGYIFPDPISPSTVCAVHPTQIYEMILYFIIFIFLRKVLHKKHFDGEVFMNYLFLAGLSRFLVEFIRLNTKYYMNLSGAQYISIVMMLIAVAWHYYYRKNILDGKS